MRRLSFKTNFRTLVILAVLVLLIFLHFGGLLIPIENLILGLVRPLQKQFYNLGNQKLYFSPKARQTAAENQLLREEINRLLAENVRLQIIKEELVAMRQEFDFIDTFYPEQNFQIARVIGKSSDNQTNVMLLDKGRQDGLKEDLVVVAQGGILVGKIMKLTDHSAQVLLATDNHFKIAATIADSVQTIGLVHGEFGLSLKMDFVPRTETIHLGDIVITSGLEDNVPRGLVIGKIEEITTQTNDLFQVAVLKPLTTLQELTLVTVLID